MKWKIVITTVLFVLVCDQVTKFWIVQNFDTTKVSPVIDGFFNLILTYNPGAAFGIMAGLPDGVRQLVLGGITVLAVGLVIYFMRNDYRDDALGQFSLALILGGAAGNVVDRVRLGRVIDFLDFYIGDYHWPAFNIADSSICVGVVILLFYRRAPIQASETTSSLESVESK